MPVSRQVWRPGQPFRLNRNSPLARGLVFWLPLMDGSRKQIDRIQGLSFEGGDGGGYPEGIGDGKFGQVMEFDDGSSEHLSASSAVLTSVPLTLAGWFNQDAAVMSTVAGIHDINGSQYINLIARGQVGRIWGQCYDGTAGTSISANTYSLNSWVHGVHVLKATNDRAVFVNGGGKGVNTTDVTPSGLDGTGVGAFRTGDVRTSYMSGLIWNVCIWNRALSDAEVRYAYDNPFDLFKPVTSQYWYIPPPKSITAARTRRYSGWTQRTPPNTQFELNTDSPLARGLVFWLPMESRSQAHTDRVRGLRLSENGTPVWVSDSKFGQVLEFNGSNHYLTGLKSPVSSTPLTLASWFYNTQDTSNDYILSIGDIDVTNNFYAIQASGAAGGDPVSLFRVDGTPDTVNTTTGYSASTWHFACGVVYAINNVAIFIDGGSKGTGSTSINPSGLDTTRVATSADSSVANWFAGRIWNACIWNRALSDAEVEYVYRNPYDLFRPVVARSWHQVPSGVGSAPSRLSYSKWGKNG